MPRTYTPLPWPYHAREARDTAAEVVAFENEITWSVIYEGRKRISGVHSFAPMPEVTCPIVDTSKANPEKVREILSKHIYAGQVTDLEIMLAKLVMVDCELSNITSLDGLMDQQSEDEYPTVDGICGGDYESEIPY
jgi:O-glycosyl hydrolase